MAPLEPQDVLDVALSHHKVIPQVVVKKIRAVSRDEITTMITTAGVQMREFAGRPAHAAPRVGTVVGTAVYTASSVMAA